MRQKTRSLGHLCLFVVVNIPSLSSSDNLGIKDIGCGDAKPLCVETMKDNDSEGPNWVVFCTED